ncbi:MAG: DUF1599 domain-containing protein [Ginsengibacter sp.]
MITMQSNTATQYDDAIESCRQIFLKKTKDYGTSWRVYRTISVADQIYIKARRVRNIQELGSQMVSDNIESEFKGILNYAVIGLIQLDLIDDEIEDLPVEQVENLYDDKIQASKTLMEHKNHDYGEAWRDMSQESFTDLILAKILRIKQIIANKGITLISEGVDANFYDILNYAVFALILINEQKLT